LGNAFRQKHKVPQVGMGIERDWGEEDNHWLLQEVRDPNRGVKCRVVEYSLRALHPVHDAASRWIGRSSAPDGHARVGSNLRQGFRKGSLAHRE
jgi:hypothetical protein